MDQAPRFFSLSHKCTDDKLLMQVNIGCLYLKGKKSKRKKKLMHSTYEELPKHNWPEFSICLNKNW